MPPFINEGEGSEEIRESLSEQIPASSEEASLERSAVDLARAEEQARVAEEKPLIGGKWKDADELLRAHDEAVRKQEEANRRLEEYNKSDKVREAWAQEQKARQEQEAADIERSARTREVLKRAGELNAAGHPEKAFALMEAYHAQNAALIAKTMLDEALKPIQERLNVYQLRDAEEQFIAHPELQDIKHMSKQATQLLDKGWAPAEIVAFLRSVNEGHGGQRPSRTEETNVLEMTDIRDRMRAESRSLAPGGGTGGPRRSAFDQEKLAEAAHRRKWLEEEFGPLPQSMKK